ncbi:hypothetical protein HHI36_013375 [Cryptolaemus montrouzieri]|uniref:Uncharacterized protein n=1 Tax=Cryptolaemus montrouzieri TaxID=559131 RepID=A0ABD2NHF0_9CUCU
MLHRSEVPQLILDTTMTNTASESVKAFSQALALPTISASFGGIYDLVHWRNIGIDELKYLVQIRPPADIIPGIIKDIIYYMGVLNAAIIYDHMFVMEHKKNVFLYNVPSRHIIISLDTLNIEEQLRNLNRMKVTSYFILGSMDNIQRVLVKADEVSMVNKKYAWYVFAQESVKFKPVINNGRIIFAKPLLNAESSDRLNEMFTSEQLKGRPPLDVAFYFDLAFHSILTIRNMMNNGSGENTEDRNYVTCDNYESNNVSERNGPDLRGALEKHLKENGQHIAGPITISSNGLSAMEVNMSMTLFNVSYGEIQKITTLGLWGSTIKSHGNFIFEKVSEFRNFKAIKLYRVVAAEQKPFIFRDANHPKGFNGYCIDLMNKIGQVLRFDYEVQLATGNTFGRMDENGNWNGLIKDLIDKKADIGLGPIFSMLEREYVVDFTIPFYDKVGIRIMMKFENVETHLFQFMSVLEDEVWYCVLGALIFTSFIIWIFDKWSPFSYRNTKLRDGEDENEREFTLKECLWFCLTSLTPQGGGEPPMNWSGRILGGTWWIFGFIVVSSYTANLAAFLTLKRLETPIKSLDDLSKQYQIQYAPMNDSQTSTYFERMMNLEKKFYHIWKDMSLNDSLSHVERANLAVWDYPVSVKYTKMWESMTKTGFPKTLDEAVERVRKSKKSSAGFAYVGDGTDIRYLEMTTCDLKPVGGEFSKRPYSIALQKGSALKHEFNMIILQLLNNRQLEEIKQKWWSGNPNRVKCKHVGKEAEGISIQNIGGIFVVVAVAIILSFISLLYELYYYKFRNRNEVVDIRE